MLTRWNSIFSRFLNNAKIKRKTNFKVFDQSHNGDNPWLDSYDSTNEQQVKQLCHRSDKYWLTAPIRDHVSPENPFIQSHSLTFSHINTDLIIWKHLIHVPPLELTFRWEFTQKIFTSFGQIKVNYNGIACMIYKRFTKYLLLITPFILIFVSLNSAK